MSNDPYGDRPSDPASGWGQDPAPDGGYGPGPGAGHDPAPGWGQDPLSTGGRPASVGKRVGAFLLDAISLSILVGLALLFITGGNMLGGGYLQGLFSALVLLAYFAIMEAGSGQTVAKRLLGIKVVAQDGSPVTMQQAALRRLPFVAGSLIPTALGGLVGFGLTLAILITAIQDQNHQGLHDRWAKTKVVDV